MREFDCPTCGQGLFHDVNCPICKQKLDDREFKIWMHAKKHLHSVYIDAQIRKIPT